MIDTGIEKSTLDYLMQALASFREIEKVLLFGSRAKGNSRPGSDIDLAIQGKNCTPEQALNLKALL
ncbi:MAG TPA: nucleotidyltransferase domain-containing protein, partial [Bacteroidales bacterium]|nr:nucleotidyltransferase domain-containing protein [Bacteroidales bacterium]